MTIFCSGIGGIGLSAYASLRRAEGHRVIGTDRSDSALLEDLRSQGIEIVLNQDGSAIPDDCSLFVYSEAIPVDAPERKRASELGIPMQSYFHALGEISKSYRVVAVCGTHGKSSTTAMAARVLIDAGLDPTVVVGTKVPELGGRNWRKGKSSLFLLEACEYRRSFHFLSPTIVLMTNADGDHFDAYKDLAEYQAAFVEFLKKLPEDGVVITHGDDADSLRIATESGHAIINADQLPLPELNVPGAHMRQNARLVAALAENLEIPQEKAKKSLLEFAGTWRRMEVKGQRDDGVTVVDDYGHHPKEIRATLSAMKEAYPTRRRVCVFQPHTHDRTIKLYDDFLTSFTDCDLLVITDVYEARKDIETAKVDIKKFEADLQAKSGVMCVYTGSLQDTEETLKKELMKPNDVLICMGAGDITRLADTMVRS